MKRALATVLRVAALQETVARGRVGAALATSRAADTAYDDAARRLQGSAPVGGAVPDALAAAALRERRATAVVAAEGTRAEAAAHRDEALAHWHAAQQRHRLLEELHARQRAEADSAREAASQRLADDLAGLRGRRTR